MIDRNGNVFIKVYDNKKNIIINRKIKELLPELVAAQINIDFEFETLKMQSIMARTILIRKSRFFGGEGCSEHKDADICIDGHCIPWMSKQEIKEKWMDDFDDRWEKLLKAEEETDKKILTLNNKVIDPKFHSTCGGSTENSENVDNTKILYLRKVLCDYCQSSPEWQGIQDISLQEIQEKLDIRINKISPFYGSDINGIIQEIERDEDGRVIKIKVGDKIFKGAEFREALGLDSTSAIYQ